MQPVRAPLVPHPSAADILLAVAPWLVVATWFLAGHSDSAGPEPQAWLRFAGILCLATLTPLPGRLMSRADIATRIRWWGWAAIAGLLVTS